MNKEELIATVARDIRSGARTPENAVEYSFEKGKDFTVQMVVNNRPADGLAPTPKEILANMPTDSNGALVLSPVGNDAAIENAGVRTQTEPPEGLVTIGSGASANSSNQTTAQTDAKHGINVNAPAAAPVVDPETGTKASVLNDGATTAPIAKAGQPGPQHDDQPTSAPAPGQPMISDTPILPNHGFSATTSTHPDHIDAVVDPLPPTDNHVQAVYPTAQTSPEVAAVAHPDEDHATLQTPQPGVQAEPKLVTVSPEVNDSVVTPGVAAPIGNVNDLHASDLNSAQPGTPVIVRSVDGVVGAVLGAEDLGSIPQVVKSDGKLTGAPADPASQADPVDLNSGVPSSTDVAPAQPAEMTDHVADASAPDVAAATPTADAAPVTTPTTVTDGTQPTPELAAHQEQPQVDVPPVEVPPEGLSFTAKSDAVESTDPLKPIDNVPIAETVPTALGEQPVTQAVNQVEATAEQTVGNTTGVPQTAHTSPSATEHYDGTATDSATGTETAPVIEEGEHATPAPGQNEQSITDGAPPTEVAADVPAGTPTTTP